MMPVRDQVEQDIMTHFALREATTGSAFDVKGFWRLTIPRYLLLDEDYSAAMRALVAKHYVATSGVGYDLTSCGATHLYGVSGAAELAATTRQALGDGDAS